MQWNAWVSWSNTLLQKRHGMYQKLGKMLLQFSLNLEKKVHFQYVKNDIHFIWSGNNNSENIIFNREKRIILWCEGRYLFQNPKAL